MSEKLPSREQALQFLYQSGCSKNVVKHCKAVADLAVAIAKACRKRGIDVNVEVVEIGAILHDIGRAKTHSVHHAIIGAKMAKSLGLPEQVISIIKKHVGGGITPEEARKLGWPKGTYTPQTLEEKIVSYADKLIEGSRRVPIERTIKKFSKEKELPPSTIDGMWELHQEMKTLIGDCECLP